MSGKWSSAMRRKSICSTQRTQAGLRVMSPDCLLIVHLFKIVLGTTKIHAKNADSSAPPLILRSFLFTVKSENHHSIGSLQVEGWSGDNRRNQTKIKCQDLLGSYSVMKALM
jgi:hypothetical protein